MGRGKEGWKGRLEKRGIVGLRCQGREELARKFTVEHRGEREGLIGEIVCCI